MLCWHVVEERRGRLAYVGISIYILFLRTDFFEWQGRTDRNPPSLPQESNNPEHQSLVSRLAGWLAAAAS